MKALLIDTNRQQVLPVEIKDWTDINKIIGSDTFTTAHQYANGDTVYVDDDGLYKNYPGAFSVKGNPQPYFVGNGLVLGADNSTGESRDVESGWLEIADSVTFLRK